jgi:hypothetical protein
MHPHIPIDRCKLNLASKETMFACLFTCPGFRSTQADSPFCKSISTTPPEAAGPAEMAQKSAAANDLISGLLLPAEILMTSSVSGSF